MASLTSQQISQTRFHLGYNYAIPAVDLSRLQRAVTEIIDTWTLTRVGELITRCEAAYALLELSAGTIQDDFETDVTGDITRTISTKTKDPYNRRSRYYLDTTNYLAKALGVRNYRDPTQSEQGFLVDGDLFVNTLPGPQGPPGAGTTWQGPWSNAQTYFQDDSVQYGGSAYIANVDNLNKVPGVDPEWDLWVSKGDVGDADSAQLNGQPPSYYLSRTNHTGLQAIATIDGLVTALVDKEPADPTILKDADIGFSVQPYNFHTVVDSQYPAIKALASSSVQPGALGVTVQGYNPNTVTDADYPTVKTTALSAVQPNDLGTAATTAATDYATAAQGALADTALQPSALNNTALTGIPTAPTATEGTNTTQLATTAFVLANVPSVNVLPNNSRINGVEHFYQSAKPLTRGDNSALVASDRWWKIDEGTEWFWNGTYWLSSNLNYVQGAVASSNSNSFTDRLGEALVFSDRNSVFIEKAQIRWEYLNYLEGVDFWNFQVVINLGNTFSSLTSVVINTFSTTTGNGYYEETINSAVTFTLPDLPMGLRIWAVKIGSPGTADFSQGLSYRVIHP